MPGRSRLDVPVAFDQGIESRKSFQREISRLALLAEKIGEENQLRLKQG